MSILFLKDLVVSAKHGVHPHEKQNPQRFNISVELTIDTSKSAQTDNISDTLNWSELRQNVIHTVEDNCFNLIEKLASEIAKNILKNEAVQQVSVSVDKLDAFQSGVPGIKLTLSR